MLFGGAIAGLLIKVVTSVYEGASKTPYAALGACVGVNLIIGIIAALAASETQTLKNFGKEAKDPKPKAAGQVGRGLVSLVYQGAGKFKAHRANELIVATLDKYKTEAQQVQALQDAFDRYDQRVAQQPQAGSQHRASIAERGDA